MEISQFIEDFKSCLHQTPAEHITLATRFKKIDDWSSIFALIVIAMIDSQYNIVLTADDIHKADTIEDLFATIQSK
jgi:acyl carrier protein